jgi:hypothetical protein
MFFYLIGRFHFSSFVLNTKMFLSLDFSRQLYSLFVSYSWFAKGSGVFDQKKNTCSITKQEFRFKNDFVTVLCESLNISEPELSKFLLKAKTLQKPAQLRCTKRPGRQMESESLKSGFVFVGHEMSQLF